MSLVEESGKVVDMSEKTPQSLYNLGSPKAQYRGRSEMITTQKCTRS